MLKSGKGPQDILGFWESVKATLRGRTPKGASDMQLSEAADAFFSAIASEPGHGANSCNAAPTGLAASNVTDKAYEFPTGNC